MNIDLTNFNKASQEKQKNVINAGFLCFGQNGYNKTSMQDIADKSGVSKASLFSYFKTKQDMYLFLYDFAGKEITNRLSKGTDDYFECAKMYVKTMAEASKDYPNLFDFIVLQAQRKDFSDIKGIIDVANNVCKTNFDVLYSNVNWSKFRDGWNKETVTNLFNFLSSGCIGELSSIMSVDEIYNEMLKYLELLKKSLYKEEYLKEENDE